MSKFEINNDSLLKIYSAKRGYQTLLSNHYKGSFWYPPGGFREWHTNQNNVTGWRFYLISLKDHPEIPNNTNYPNSFLSLMRGDEIIRCPDSNYILRLFHLRDDKNDLNFHSVSSINQDRYSIGYQPSDKFVDYLIENANVVY